MSIEVTDEDLREFLEWFGRWHGHKAVDVSVMTTCMTGHFKTYPKAADKLLARCKHLQLVTVTDGMVTITAP